MKYIFTIAALVCIILSATAQQSTYVTASAYNTQNAMPFAKFSGLFNGVIHPGIELGYGKDVWKRSKHFWFLELKTGLFYHRYVQYGIPLYFDFGYNHVVASGFSIKTSIGAGYMHSIPAADKFKLNSNGEYKNNKGIGRMQAIATFGLGLEYRLKSTASRPVVIFTNYQQRIQFPFVKSYVPFLPYNSFMIGIHLPVKKINQKNKLK
ncbi:MAG: hypothetical protein ABI280_15785 [Ginsengibacter sp.]